MKKVFLTIIILFFILAVLGSFSIGYLSSIEKEKVEENISVPGLKINYSNIEEEFSENYLVKAIPSGEKVSLKFYNFNSGDREIEKSFIIGQGTIREAEETTEVILLLNSKYLAEMTNKNFCEILKKANDGGDLEIQTNLSSISLAWKFKSMYEFKDCF